MERIPPAFYRMIYDRSDVMKARKGIWAVLAGVTGSAAMMTALIYRQVFVCPKKRPEQVKSPSGSQYQPYKEQAEELREKIRELPYEEVSVRSQDGLKLYGKYYEQKPGAPLEILFHGYHGAAERDFCGGFWLAREAGHNVILVDERGHGKSEGRVLSFGIKEQYDCLEWTKYATERFGEDTKIVLGGISMGAAIVLLAAGLDLPNTVKGILADCGYTSPKEIVQKVSGDRGLPVKIMYPLARLGAKLFGHFDLEDGNTEEALRKCKVPVLFIHGEDDRLVPCEMSRRNYAACASEKMIFTVPEAGHTLSYMVDYEGYRETVSAFMKKIGCETDRETERSE